MSKIGKLSGQDWSNAPHDAEHVYTGQFNSMETPWRKNLSGGAAEAWHFGKWEDVVQQALPIFYISKEDDLGMQKIEKTVHDIEVGMFLKYINGRVLLVSSVSVDDKLTRRYDLVSMANTETMVNVKNVGVPDSWSYVYDGEYTPFVQIETEEDKKLKELKATIEQAQKQIDAIVKGK